MENIQALQLFIKKEAADLSTSFVAESMLSLTKAHRNDTVEQFCGQLRRVISKAAGLQFLQITMLRSKALLGEPFYRLEAYGPEFYLSEPLYETELSLDWLYQPFDRFRVGLKQESKKYVDQIGQPELDQILMAELYNCQKIVKFCFSETLLLLIQSPEYQALDAKKKIQFQLGERMGEFDILLTKDENLTRMEGVLNELLHSEADE